MAYKRILTFAVGIALTLLVIQYFGFDSTMRALQSTKLSYLFLAIIIQLAILGLMVLRIKVLTYSKGYLSMAQAVRLTLSGMFVSMVTPLAKLGGEPLKMYMLSKNLGHSTASVAILVESIMELLSSVFVVLIVFLILFNQIPGAFVATIILFLIVMGLLVGILLKILFTPRWLYKIINWVGRKAARLMKGKALDYGDILSTAFYAMFRQKKVVFATFLISFLMKILEVARLWIIFMALSTVLPFPTVLIVWIIILIVMFIPWLPGSLGLVEFSGIAAFITLGISSGVGASAMILDRLVSFWMPLFLGMIALSMAKHKNELPNLDSFWKKSEKKQFNLRNK